MIIVGRILTAGALALMLAGPVLADETPASAPAVNAPAPDDKAAAKAKAAADEVLCRSDSDEDTGHHMRHRTCMKRSEWAEVDKKAKSS